MAQWAWEFLRRFDDYRQQWSRTIAPFLKEDGGFDEAAWDRAIEIKVRRPAMMARQPYHIANRFDVLARTFGLHSTTGGFDPRRTHRPVFEGHGVTLYGWRSDIWPPPLDDTLLSDPQNAARIAKLPPMRPTPLARYEYWVKISTVLPLRPQFDAAEELMQGYADAVPPDRRVRLGKPQPKKFASYLRILDFDTVGETDGVIGECLCPSHYTPDQRRAAVRDTRNAARHWRNGYLRIAMTE